MQHPSLIYAISLFCVFFFFFNPRRPSLHWLSCWKADPISVSQLWSSCSASSTYPVTPPVFSCAMLWQPSPPTCQCWATVCWEIWLTSTEWPVTPQLTSSKSYWWEMTISQSIMPCNKDTWSVWIMTMKNNLASVIYAHALLNSK